MPENRIFGGLSGISTAVPRFKKIFFLSWSRDVGIPLKPPFWVFFKPLVSENGRKIKPPSLAARLVTHRATHFLCTFYPFPP